MKKYIKYGLFSLLSIAAFSACSNVDEWEPPVSEEELLIYSADFSKDLGMFDAVSVDGDQKWEYSAAYSCMVMTGYVDSNGDGVKENNANEDWLISPEIDLKALTAAKVTFEHAGNYFATIENSTTLWISEDYKDGLPSTGIWTQLTITKDITNSDFTFVTPEISLTKYVGKKVRIAFKYNSTTAKAGTWEVKNFSVKSGEAKVEPVEDNGKGTEVSPFNVKGAISNQSSGKWVTGIIVGYIPAGTQAYFIFGADTCTQATNLLLADSSNIPYHSKALPVQLPSGAVRNGLNLKDHKNLIGKKVKMYGDLTSYFNVPGYKNVTYYELEDGTSGGTKPITDEDFNIPELYIADLRAMWTGNALPLTERKKVVGVVITDLVGGNLGSLKNLTITSKDNSAGIMVRMVNDNSYQMGDLIEIILSGSELNQYGAALQINNLPNLNTRKIGTMSITPRVTTIADINTNYTQKNYESTLVTVTGTVTSASGTWYSGTSSGQNNTITSGTDKIISYVTKYATFAKNTLPNGEKSITGVAGRFNTTYQINIRNLNDVK